MINKLEWATYFWVNGIIHCAHVSLMELAMRRLPVVVCALRHRIALAADSEVSV